MSVGKGAATGSTFLTGVLAKLSPEDRQKGEQALEALKALGGGTVIAAVGDGVLAQDEFSRLTNDLRTQQEDLTARTTELEQRDTALAQWRTDLAAWQQQEKQKLDTALRAAGGRQEPPKVEPPAGITEDRFGEQLSTERAAFLGFQRDQNAITRDHFTKFGEIVDLEPLLRHPSIAQVGLLGVYELVHKDRLTSHQAAAQKKHDDTVAAEAVRKHLEAQASMPYPSPTGSGSGSPLDGLTTGAKDSVVDAATAHYARLQAERAGAAH